MASRMNVRFVVVLVGALVLVFAGVAGALVLVQLKSADRYIRLGEAAFEAGDYERADFFLGRAVYRRQTDVELLEKWRRAREHKVPPTRTTFDADYGQYVGGILRALANAQRTNVEAHRTYLQARHDQLALARFHRGAWDAMIEDTESALRFFEMAEQEDTRWHVLRRYRGLALMNILLSDTDSTPDQLVRARDDLETALAADPTDGAVAVALSTWHSHVAEVARSDANPVRAREHEPLARRVLEDFLAANPGDVDATIHKLRLDVMDAFGRVSPDAPAAEQVRERRARLEALRPALDRVVAVIQGAPPEKVDLKTVSILRVLAGTIEPAEDEQAALEVLDRVISARPEDSTMLFVRGRILAERGDREAAIAQFQRIIDLRERPVSLAGLVLHELKLRARYQQALLAAQILGLHQDRLRAATDDAARANEQAAVKTALARATTYRQELARELPESAPDLMYVDARMRLAQGDVGAARRLLTDYSRVTMDQTEEAPDVIAILGHIALMENQLGLARERFEKLLELQPGNIRAQLVLAEVEVKLRRTEKASELYRKVLDADPDNEVARRELRVLQTITGHATLDDPVEQLIAEAVRLASGSERRMPDDKAAMRLLEEGLEEHRHDPRLAVALGKLRFQTGDTAGAIRLAGDALARHPDSLSLRELLRQFSASESVEGMVKLIEEGEGGETEKLIAKYVVYVQAGREAESREQLRRLSEAAPDDPRVVEYAFLDALNRGDMGEAGRIAERAARLDTDRADGLTFRARVQIAMGNHREAIRMLQQATDRGTANANVWFLLGSVQGQLGRTESLASFRRALDLNPTEVQTIKVYVAALVRAGREREGLDVARASHIHGQRDRDFVNLWLMLEASVGNRQFAVERRQEVMRVNPEDVANATALAQLHMEDRRWEASRAIIDRLRAAQDSLALAQLDARWHADRGDLEGARSVFVGYIGKLVGSGEPVGDGPYLTFGAFLLERGEVEDGLAAMEQAARHQDPATRRADLARADALARLGRYSEAERLYREVLAQVADPHHEVRKRLVDSLIQQQRFADARREIEAAGAAGEEDLALVVQRAQALNGLGDKRGARDVLDRAVAKFPGNPLPYYQRARVLMTDPLFVRDALADLDTSLRLNEGFWPALRTRAAIHLSMGRTDDAIKDVRAAVNANPGLEELRFSLLAELLARGDENEAVQVAQTGLRLRPNDVRLANGLGDVFAQAGLWGRAAMFYLPAWEALRDEASALRLVDAYLRSKTPALGEAEAVLSSGHLKVAQSPRLMMQRAALRSRSRLMEAAEADSWDALRLAGEDPQALTMWYSQLKSVFPERGQLLGFLGRVRVGAGAEDWITFFRADQMLDHKDSRADGYSLLRGLLERSRNTTILTVGAKLLAGRLHSDGRYEEALRALLEGLKTAPGDVELNNNVASVLTDNLGRAPEALEYAERAAEGAPQNPSVLDTLGATYQALGQHEKAEERLVPALRLATRAADKAMIAIRLARLKADRGEMQAAREYLDLVRDLGADHPELMRTMQEQLTEMERKIGGR